MVLTGKCADQKVKINAKCEIIKEENLPQIDEAFLIDEKSHDEVDLEIQYNRVIYVIIRAMEKIMVLGYLPTLIANNGEILREHFDVDTVEFILSICENENEIVDTLDDRSAKDVKIKKKELPSAVLRSAKMDQTMLEVIATLYNHKSMKRLILGNDSITYDISTTNLLQAMKALKCAAEARFSMSASQEKVRQAELRDAWRDNLEKKKDIDKLQKQLDSQRNDYLTQNTLKKKLIEQYRHRIETMRRVFKEKIDKRVQESEKIMGMEAAASEMKIYELTNDSKTAIQDYNALLDSHILYEKTLRSKRFKVESQLASWLAKYDQDIGERSAEIEKLTEEFEAEKEEMDKLQDLFDEQEEEYDELMAEKDEEDRRIDEEKMYLFLSHRSAKLIQRTWRAYWERKLARKRAKKAKAKDRKLKAESGEQVKKVTIKEGKKGKGKKGKKKKDKKERKANRETDLVKSLENLVKGDLLDDLTTPAFNTGPVAVEL